MIAHYLTITIGFIGVLIIVWGVVAGLKGFLLMKYHQSKESNINQDMAILRRDLSSYLLFGLEFLLAADIVYTIMEPDLDEVMILGIIVLIRTVLTYSLSKE